MYTTGINLFKQTNPKGGFDKIGVRVMVFNATFNNISAISWRTVVAVEEIEFQEKTTALPQVTD
jgi:hypothetical protein